MPKPVMAPVPELPVQYLAYQPLLERLMAKSREQRIGSCDELLNGLEQMRQTHDSSIIDPSTLLSVRSGS
jgi:serine/threonine-protein kinase PpkA